MFWKKKNKLKKSIDMEVDFNEWNGNTESKINFLMKIIFIQNVALSSLDSNNIAMKKLCEKTSELLELKNFHPREKFLRLNIVSKKELK